MVREQVVLVDKNDNQIGLMDKLEAHQGKGVLHRAISVLLYRKKKGAVEVLLQKRAADKPLWPFFWTNTICTHPRDGETAVDCAVRRLEEEMGIVVKKEDLQFVYKLLYQAQYTSDLAEHEFDSLFVSEWDGNLAINPREVADARWISAPVLQAEMTVKPNTFTPWVHMFMKEEKVKNLLG